MNREGSPNVPAEVSISFGLIFLSKPSLLSACVAITFISVFTIPMSFFGGASVGDADGLAVGDAGEPVKFCNGLDTATRSVPGRTELICADAPGKEKKSITTKKLLGDGEGLWLSIRRPLFRSEFVRYLLLG
jgi:hypothetical protein